MQEMARGLSLFEEALLVLFCFCFCFNLFLAVSGLSCRTWYLLLRHMGFSLVVVHGLSSCGVPAQLPCNMWDLSSLTRDRTRIPCIGRQILNHWTTREVPRHCQFLRHRTRTQNGTRSLQQPFRMQSSATVSSMTRKNELLPRHHWIVFSRGQIELNPARKQNLCHQRQA